MSGTSTASSGGAKRGILEMDLVSGLGNRLLALLCGLTLAELSGARLRLRWRPEPNICPVAFADLLEPITSLDVEWVEGAVDPRDFQTIHRFDLEQWRHLLQGGEIRCCWFALPAHPCMSEQEYFMCFRRHVERLVPSKAVRALVVPRNSDRMGVHMRGTDHFPALALTPLWCYRSALEAIAHRNPGAEVLLCSDDLSRVAPVLEGLELKYVPSASIGLPKHQVRGTAAGIQAAFADLLMLSQCRAVVSSPQSTFAQSAVMLSGARWITVDAFPGSQRAKARTAVWAFHQVLRYEYPSGPFLPRRDVSWIGSRFAALVARLVVSSVWQKHARLRSRNGFKREFLARLEGQ